MNVLGNAGNNCESNEAKYCISCEKCVTAILSHVQREANCACLAPAQLTNQRWPRSVNSPAFSSFLQIHSDCLGHLFLLITKRSDLFIHRRQGRSQALIMPLFGIAKPMCKITEKIMAVAFLTQHVENLQQFF